MTLEERIEALEKKIGIYKLENKRWRAEKGEKYWFALHDGLIDFNEEENDIIDEGCYNRGNYFKTEEEAVLYDQKRVLIQQVKDIAIRLGEPTEDDWKDSDVEKFFLVFGVNPEYIDVNSTYVYKNIGSIYCLDKNFLKVCLEEIGEENLKLIF